MGWADPPLFYNIQFFEIFILIQKMPSKLGGDQN